MAFREIRIALDRLLERADLPVAIAHLFVQPRQIERGLVTLGVRLQLRQVLAFGGAGIAALFREQREIEVRQPQVRLGRERLG